MVRMCIFIYLWCVNTQTELNVSKKRCEKAERNHSDSMTKNQQLTAKNQEMTVSSCTCTIKHAAWCYMKWSVRMRMSLDASIFRLQLVKEQKNSRNSMTR